MNQAELIVTEKISEAFNGVKPKTGAYDFESWQEIPDSWLSENEDIFAYYSHADELFLLPAYLCFLLRTDKDDPESQIYMNISNTLTQYSKEKTVSCFKNSLSVEQFSAVKAFLKHFTHNKSVNLDLEQWNKTLSNWTRIEKKI